MSRSSPLPLPPRDVIFLVADKGMEQMLLGFLGRDGFHRSLRCGPFSFNPASDIIVDPGRDSGVYLRAHEILRAFEGRYAHAVVMLDAAWEGSPGAATIHDDIAQRMKGAWEHFAVVVIDPELEAWIWQDSPVLAQVFRCPADFRAILARSGHWPADAAKPPDPKAALEYLRRRYKVKAFNADFGKLAAKISVRHCQDTAFNHLCDHLRAWFPANPGFRKHP